jgi:hypothetical protein
MSPSSIIGVYCDACHSKSTIQKLNFLHGSIVTHDEAMLLIIKGKWLEAFVHMTKSEFLNLPHPKQVQLLILIRIHGKFRLSPASTLVGFQKDIQQFIPRTKTSLKGEAFVVPLKIILNDNVQQSVKCKLNFVESKTISKQKPL